MLYSIIGILVIILDQLVKYFVDQNINWTKPVIELIPNVLSLVRVQNDGAAFSFLSGGSARIWFIALTAIFAILVVIALATNFVSGRFGRWCLVFITAGGLSNMIDRIRFGFVIDMFRIDMFDFADKKGVSGWYRYDSEFGYFEVEDVIAWQPKPKLPKKRRVKKNV